MKSRAGSAVQERCEGKEAFYSKCPSDINKEVRVKQTVYFQASIHQQELVGMLQQTKQPRTLVTI